MNRDTLRNITTVKDGTFRYEELLAAGWIVAYVRNGVATMHFHVAAFGCNHITERLCTMCKFSDSGHDYLRV